MRISQLRMANAFVGSTPHVTVVGAGLVGLTSAHSLLCRGFRVTVLDKRSHVASECSFGNAALLMTSYSRPKTATIGQLVRWAITRSEPVHVSWRAMIDPAMVSFGIRFLLAGPQKASQIKRATQITSSLASASVDLIDCIREEHNMATASTNEGLLMFFTDKGKLDATFAEAREVMSDEQMQELVKVVTPDECVSLEPTLASRKNDLIGGLFWPKDRTMCSLSFARDLASKLEQSGASFELNEEVVSASYSNGEHHLSLASGRRLNTDAVVVAAGVTSGHLMKQLASVGPPGLSALPLYGMRGHSLTVEASHLCGKDEKVLQRSIADCDSMTFYSPLPEKSGSPQKLLRIAGFGDFDGWGFGPGAVRPWRLQQLRAAAEKTFGTKLWGGRETTTRLSGEIVNPPELVPEDDSATTWCGLRPMSPDGLPLIGRVLGKDNSRAGLPIFVNAGHGALGWTLSAASGKLLAEAVSKEMSTSSDTSEFSGSKDLYDALPNFDPNRFRWPHVLKSVLLAKD